MRVLNKKRAVEIPADLLTTDPAAIVDDPDIQVLIEVAGGEEPMRSYLERALQSGKHVITANKVVMAKHGPELLAYRVPAPWPTAGQRSTATAR